MEACCSRLSFQAWSPSVAEARWNREHCDHLKQRASNFCRSRPSSHFGYGNGFITVLKPCKQKQREQWQDRALLAMASSSSSSSDGVSVGNGAADQRKAGGTNESPSKAGEETSSSPSLLTSTWPSAGASGEGQPKPSSEVKRAGLFRTPISGGVQTATSVHGLPAPAVAVRNLTEQARFAHLCTIMSRMHHRRRGYPFGSLVDFATDQQGHPIFSLSPLAIHTRNLLADPRCTLVVQIPGWSGLANARVTLFGDVYPLPREQQEWAQKLYQTKHHHGASQQWGNFYFYRMETISDIYFVGGFGTVAWVDVKEYASAQPDMIAANGAEETLQELNGRFSKQLKKLLAAASEEQSQGKVSVDDAALISIDSKGVDIRVRQGAQFNVQRMAFDGGQSVDTLDQAMAALQRLVEKGAHSL